jgi:iron only hydrogenase large subunit-like protein
MDNNYNEIFKNIVRSLKDDNFDVVIKEIMDKPDIDKDKLAKVVSSLCGVELSYDENFIENLKTAINNYQMQHKIVSKISRCEMDCVHGDESPSCMKSCPFNAIIFNKEKNNTIIDLDKCTDCGFCVDACPTGSIVDKVEFLPLFNMLKNGAPVVAAVAPAISGQFGDAATVDKLRTAFMKLGFIDMVEVAFFADILTLKESIEFDHLVKKEDDLMITSCCCPMWVGMLRRVYNDLVKHVSPSISPMIAAGRVLKKLNPDCKVVFVGPCIAKKAEAKEKDLLGDIDFVLTFTELKDIFEAMEIDPIKLEETPSTDYASKGGRLYARAGGVSIAISESLKEIFPGKHKFFKPISADGVNDCKSILDKAKNGDINANFIEGMGCVGGCVGGPKSIVSKETGKEQVDKFAESSSIKVSVESQCIKDILAKIGIESIDDFKTKEKSEIFERQF